METSLFISRLAGPIPAITKSTGGAMLSNRLLLVASAIVQLAVGLGLSWMGYFGA
jgi:hypothetical protein